MANRRRLAILVSSPLVVLIGLTSTQVAAFAQGQGFKPAGNYSNTSMLASFNFTPTDPSQTSVFVFLNRQTVVGPSGTTDETSMFLNVSTDFGFGTPNFNICALLANPSDFNVSSGVLSASLHTTITPNTQSCGGSVTSDVTVDISWTGAGPVQTTHTANRFSCSGYSDESQGSDSNNAGPATFNITGLGSPITTTDPQVYHFGRSLERVQGAVPPDTCRGSVGRGAGRPTPAAGNYYTTLEETSTFFFSGDGTSFLFLNVNRNTNSSNPLAGPLTSMAQTDLQFSVSSTSVNAGGCFLIDPKDFTFGASTASLHTVLTSGPNGCNGETNFISPDPFPIDVSWVGTAPVATTRIDNQYSCLGYRFQTGVGQVLDSVADATVSMPGLSGTLPGSASIGSIDTRTHADGTPAPGCFFRG